MFIPFVVVLLFLIPVMAYLAYRCSVYKAEVGNLLFVINLKKYEISSLKRYIDNKEKERGADK